MNDEVQALTADLDIFRRTEPDASLQDYVHFILLRHDGVPYPEAKTQVLTARAERRAKLQ